MTSRNGTPRNPVAFRRAASVPFVLEIHRGVGRYGTQCTNGLRIDKGRP